MTLQAQMWPRQPLTTFALLQISCAWLLSRSHPSRPIASTAVGTHQAWQLPRGTGMYTRSCIHCAPVPVGAPVACVLCQPLDDLEGLCCPGQVNWVLHNLLPLDCGCQHHDVVHLPVHCRQLQPRARRLQAAAALAQTCSPCSHECHAGWGAFMAWQAP